MPRNADGPKHGTNPASPYLPGMTSGDTVDGYKKAMKAEVLDKKTEELRNKIRRLLTDDVLVFIKDTKHLSDENLVQSVGYQIGGTLPWEGTVSSSLVAKIIKEEASKPVRCKWTIKRLNGKTVQSHTVENEIPKVGEGKVIDDIPCKVTEKLTGKYLAPPIHYAAEEYTIKIS